jgi:hypothetical protein
VAGAALGGRTGAVGAPGDPIGAAGGRIAAVPASAAVGGRTAAAVATGAVGARA